MKPSKKLATVITPITTLNSRKSATPTFITHTGAKAVVLEDSFLTTVALSEKGHSPTGMISQQTLAVRLWKAIGLSLNDAKICLTQMISGTGRRSGAGAMWNLISFMTGGHFSALKPADALSLS